MWASLSLSSVTKTFLRWELLEPCPRFYFFHTYCDMTSPYLFISSTDRMGWHEHAAPASSHRPSRALQLPWSCLHSPRKTMGSYLKPSPPFSPFSSVCCQLNVAHAMRPQQSVWLCVLSLGPKRSFPLWLREQRIGRGTNWVRPRPRQSRGIWGKLSVPNRKCTPKA